MFIANLIENEKYYKYISGYNPVLSLAWTIIFLFRYWLIKYLKIFGIAIVAFALVFVVVYGIIITRRIYKYINGRKIKINNDHIIIETKKGDIVQDIDIKSVDKIILLEDYSIPKDNLKNFFKQLLGKRKKFYFILEKDSKKQRFDILMPSYYMGLELNKIIEDWKHRQDLNIEYIK